MNMLNFQSKELNLLKYLPTLSKIGVIYLAQYIIHVSAERSKVTNTFGLLSCSWRDDQIRMLQGAQNIHMVTLLCNITIDLLHPPLTTFLIQSQSSSELHIKFIRLKKRISVHSK